MDDFKKGDVVRFQITSHSRPRWNFDIERPDKYATSCTPQWVIGEVIAADKRKQTFATTHGKSILWSWPQPSNADYPALYGVKVGYLQQYNVNDKLEEETVCVADVKSGVCQCDMTRLINIGHDSDCPEATNYAKSIRY